MKYSPIEYACGIFNALFAEGDVIYDHIEKAPSPPDHYAYTFAALAGILIYRRTGELDFRDQAEQLLRAYLDFPDENIGHWEFNKYALAEILHTGIIDDGGIISQVTRYLGIQRWQSGPYMETSYNWLALRALYHYIAGINGLPDGNVDRAKEFIDGYVLKRQTGDGFFYDYSNPDPKTGLAAPLTYHAKICFCLLRYWELSGDPDIVSPAIKALRVLNDTIFLAGDAFWFGRTNGGLFGYAAALYAFSAAISSGLIEGDGPIAQAYNKLLAALERMRRDDGTFALNHHPGQNRRPAWDGYMFHTVYNAYAAALFALAPDVNPPEPANEKPSDISFDIGIRVVRKKSDEAAFAAAGQMVSGQGGFFADGRYIGMQPMLLRDETGVVIPPPPYDSSSIPDRLSPRSLGFVPVLRCDGVDYAPHIYREIADNDGILIGMGEPAAVEYRPLNGLPRIYRLAHKLLIRVSKYTYRNMRVHRLTGVNIKRALLWMKEEKAVISATKIIGGGEGLFSGSGVRYLKDRNCAYAIVTPETGYEIKVVERETAWGTAVISYPQFEETPPLLIEALCWGDVSPDKIPSEIIEKIIGTI